MGELLNIMATVTKETNVIPPMMPKIIGNQFSEFGGGGTGVQSSQHSLSWQYPGRGINTSGQFVVLHGKFTHSSNSKKKKKSLISKFLKKIHFGFMF